jgi:hypothetical protein
MNNIKTEQDVLEWAEMIVNGKGEKYVPLGKADMYAIANFVVVHSPSEPLPEPPPPPSPELVDKKPLPPEDKKPCNPLPPSYTPAKTTKAVMTRGYALHRAGFDTQQAYDKFLDWCKEHPKEGSVMDFSTGKKSSEAAFAYWLMENIEVEIPANAR